MEAIRDDFIKAIKHLFENDSSEAIELGFYEFMETIFKQRKKNEMKLKKPQKIIIDSNTDPEMLEFLINDRTKLLKRFEYKGKTYEPEYSDEITNKVLMNRVKKNAQYQKNYYEKTRKPKIQEKLESDEK